MLVSSALLSSTDLHLTNCFRTRWNAADIPRQDGANGGHRQQCTLVERAGQTQDLWERRTRINTLARTRKVDRTRMPVLQNGMVDLRNTASRRLHDNSGSIFPSDIQDGCLRWNRRVDYRSFSLAGNSGGNASTDECANREHCRVHDGSARHFEGQFEVWMDGKLLASKEEESRTARPRGRSGKGRRDVDTVSCSCCRSRPCARDGPGCSARGPSSAYLAPLSSEDRRVKTGHI